jgi:hypothetical protein
MKSTAERSSLQGSKAMKSILDPTFKYYSSVDTDLRRTFRNVRQEMREAPSTRADPRQPAAPAPVVHFPTRRRAPVAG